MIMKAAENCDRKHFQDQAVFNGTAGKIRKRRSGNGRQSAYKINGGHIRNKDRHLPRDENKNALSEDQNEFRKLNLQRMYTDTDINTNTDTDTNTNSDTDSVFRGKNSSGNGFIIIAALLSCQRTSSEINFLSPSQKCPPKRYAGKNSGPETEFQKRAVKNVLKIYRRK